MRIELEKIKPTDYQISYLFKLLKRRTFSISHSTMPTFEEHRRFVNNNPYRAWFIVKINGTNVGAAYVQYDNSVGLNGLDSLNEAVLKRIIDLLAETVEPLEPIPSVRYGSFFFNVAASNSILMNKLASIGYIQSQVIYVAVGNSSKGSSEGKESV